MTTINNTPGGDEGTQAVEQPQRRPPFWLFLTLLGSFPTLLWFVADWRSLHGIVINNGHVWGRDFVNVWTGGRLVLEGRSHLVYALNDYIAYQRELFGPIEAHFYSYPPSTLFLAAPFGLVPYLAALALWLIGTLALFLWAARPYVREVPNFPLIFAALTPAALVNVWAGHYGFLVGALWLACFWRVERMPGRSGIFAALLTIKPHLGLLLPPLLIARRAWRTFFVAATGAVAIIAVSGIVFGFDLWFEYLTRMSLFQASLLEKRTSFFLTMMPGTFTSLRLVGGSSDVIAWTLHIAVAAAAAFMVWRAERSGTGMKDLAFISATATFLILPYAFNYDMTVVSLGFALMLFRWWEDLSPWQRIALIGGYLSPQLTFVGMLVSLPITPFVLLAGLYVQVRLCAPRPEGAAELALART